MPAPRNLLLNKPALFVPSVVRSIRQTGGNVQTFTLSEMSASALSNSSSYRYDLQGNGLRSTQQLKVDWSDFANHVFFHSAQVKVNAAIRKIFDVFPFDGTKEENEVFFDSLTGYEKYVYDLLPKNVGYLCLSGTRSGYESGRGTYVVTKDIVGSEYPTLVRSATGKSIINPGSLSMTTEFHLFLPTTTNTNQVIFQKVSSSVGLNDQGISIFLSGSSSTNTANVQMVVVSGSSVLSSSAVRVSKGSFNHLAFVWDRTPGISRIYGFNNQQLVASSSAIETGNLLFDAAPIIIGSGSEMGGFQPVNTLSGAIDEFRIWHSVRTSEERNVYKDKNVYANGDLKLYYKFNEPARSDSQIVLDHSGYGLHGTLNTYAANTLGVREYATASFAGPSPISKELLRTNPVLFSAVPSVATLTGSLLSAANTYDNNNPNWIVNLIPPHLLLEGQYQDALSTVDGDIVDVLNYGTTGVKDVSLGKTQVLLMLLYTCASFYDELKLFLDSFGNILSVDYDTNDTVPDEFLQTLADKFGIKLPSLFSNSSVQQFVNAEDLEDGNKSLFEIQNSIWRRMLINIQDVLNSKGTLHGVKSFIRSIGIDPDNNFRIREYGGATKRSLVGSREKRSEAVGVVNVSDNAFASSPYLFAARTEPGFPATQGSASDGLLTSGSWTVEGTYKFFKPAYPVQSIARLQTTGSQTYLVANLLAVSGTGVTLYARPNATGSAPTLSMSLTGFNPMDGQHWSISFGRNRGDELGHVSSSYFLRAAHQNYGNITEEYSSSVFFDDNGFGGPNLNLFSSLNSTYNPSGSYLAFGSQSFSSSDCCLNSVQDANVTYADNKTSQIRFWSKGLTNTEWKEHVRNPKSLGVDKPKTSFNFITNATGSFGRLRLDVSCDQAITSSNGSGDIQLFDYSQNAMHLSGVSFPPNTSVISPETMYYSYLSSHFDDGATTDKVRVRSFQNFENVLNGESDYASMAPMYEIEKSEEPQDNARFSIDMSVVDLLNQDIATMFASLDEFNNALGGTEQMFSSDYKDLEQLRTIYFNRLVDKIQIKIFFEFYKWFDMNIGKTIANLLPRKTKFLGTNYVVESHMLERPKIEYRFSDMYLGEDTRHGLKNTITLQQFAGNISKF